MSLEVFNILKKEEEALILKLIFELFKLDLSQDEISDEDRNSINTNLHLVAPENIAHKAHEIITNVTCAVMYEKYFPSFYNEIIEKFGLINSELDLDLKSKLSDLELNPELLEKLHVEFLNSIFTLEDQSVVRKKSKHYLKEKGAVYTLPEISREIVEGAIQSQLKFSKLSPQFRCLDFACGTGRFYLESLNYLVDSKKQSVEKTIINNLFAVDIDETAIKILRTIVLFRCSQINSELIDAISNNILVGNVLYDDSDLFEQKDYWLSKFKLLFCSNEDGIFNVVFSNPPYYLLKVNNKEGNNEYERRYFEQLKKRIKSEVSFFRNSGKYMYSTEGMLNYYQLSIERILQVSVIGGSIGIICPSSIFGDITSRTLRKHLLFANELKSIKYFSESVKLFENVSQSTVIFQLQKSLVTSCIDISVNGNEFRISIDDILQIFGKNFEVPLIDNQGWIILKKLAQIKKLKDYHYLKNRRGEFDLTLHSKFISSVETDYQLVRGRSIGNGNFVMDSNEYVNVESFLKSKSKEFVENDFGKKRLVCPQISNVDSRIRLKFAFSTTNKIVANSCNYIYSTRDEVDLSKLYFILNSKLINWRFKITSSNNHVNNYEIDELPILNLDDISIGLFKDNQSNIDEYISKLYGLTSEEINYIDSKFQE
jgi:adenine-specific DNA-methyltransferase